MYKNNSLLFEFCLKQDVIQESWIECGHKKEKLALNSFNYFHNQCSLKFYDLVS